MKSTSTLSCPPWDALLELLVFEEEFEFELVEDDFLDDEVLLLELVLELFLELAFELDFVPDSFEAFFFAFEVDLSEPEVLLSELDFLDLELVVTLEFFEDFAVFEVFEDFVSLVVSDCA